MQREPDSTTPAATAAHATAEAAFATYRRDGQPAGLAEAFERTVGELLRVAAFLLPRDEVEDAVHDTYVVAIARRDRWDDQQALLPWLLGILANEARDRRRRRRRQAPVRTNGVPAADPVRAAQAAEFEAGFAQALREMPAADADLLRLHLCDELSCREIGERLRRPAGTVRTQVARAMGSLRRRLPVALGTSGVGFEVPPALATLRARVLASAVRRLCATRLLRPRVLLAGALGIAALVAIALPLWSGAKDRGVLDAGNTRGVSTPAVAAAGAGAPADPRSAPPPASERTPLLPPAATKAPWLLRGRVHDERGLPIAGARVALRHGEFEPRILLVHSIADGTFELDLGYWRDRPALDRRGFFVHLHADGFHAFPHFGQFPAEARPDQPLELTLDVPGLSPYPTVSGRVVDADGKPVPAVIMVDEPKENGHMFGHGHADEDGTFLVVLGGIEDGKVVVKAKHGNGVDATAEAQVQRGVATRLGTIVLGAGHPVTGRVELRDGTPLANCELSLWCEGGRGLADAVTDREGRFRYARPLANAWGVQLMEVHLREGGIWGPKSEFAASDTNVRVVADAALLELRWLDPDGIELLPAPATVTVWLAGSDKVFAQHSGNLAHAVVPPGSRVRIASSGSAHAVTAELTAPAGGRQRCDLQFRAVPRAPFRVELTWNDGKPVEAFECSAWSTDPALSMHAQQTAAAAGRCELLSPVGKVRIRVNGMPGRFDGGEVEVEAEVPADGSGVARVVLPRLGRVAITLRDRAANERIDDDFAADVVVGAIELDQFTWTDGEMEMTSTEPPLGRRLECLRLLPPGSHEVAVTAAGWLPAKARVEVVADKVAEVVVWLQKQD